MVEKSTEPISATMFKQMKYGILSRVVIFKTGISRETIEKTWPEENPEHWRGLKLPILRREYGGPKKCLSTYCKMAFYPRLFRVVRGPLKTKEGRVW